SLVQAKVDDLPNQGHNQQAPESPPEGPSPQLKNRSPFPSKAERSSAAASAATTPSTALRATPSRALMKSMSAIRRPNITSLATASIPRQTKKPAHTPRVRVRGMSSSPATPSSNR